VIGQLELIIILVVVFLLFGAKRLPDIARGIGKGIREFRRALEGRDEDEEKKKNGKPPAGGGADGKEG
jgi:sec-independent protein translocase protein TatA